jgi:hypothetical protein
VVLSQLWLWHESPGCSGKQEKAKEKEKSKKRKSKNKFGVGQLSPTLSPLLGCVTPFAFIHLHHTSAAEGTTQGSHSAP